MIRLAFVAVLLLALTYQAVLAMPARATPTGSLALTAPAVVPIQVPFLVTVTGQAPDGGYVGVQTKVTHQGASYAPTAAPVDEAIWPDCVTAARFIGNGNVLWACVAGPPYTGPSAYSGPLAAFAFQCPQPAVVPFALVPRPGDTQLGTHYVTEATDTLDPTLAGVTVDCAVDYDADGCDDVTELAAGRDHLDPWDWPDVNDNGNVNAQDIALVVAGFGTASPDVTGDGIVSVQDIAAVVSQFGQIC
jgi:hypothetical protein